MADLCVLYLSDDQKTVATLVRLLGTRWSVWWDEHISHGDWEQAVREQILLSRAVIPILSGSAITERTAILRDEISFAHKHKKAVLPFIIGEAEIPFWGWWA